MEGRSWRVVPTSRCDTDHLLALDQTNRLALHQVVFVLDVLTGDTREIVVENTDRIDLNTGHGLSKRLESLHQLGFG